MRENKRIKEHYQQCLQKYNKTTFSDEENKLLLSLVSNNGNKWTSFGKYFPDRSIPLIKNAYKNSRIPADKSRYGTSHSDTIPLSSNKYCAMGLDAPHKSPAAKAAANPFFRSIFSQFPTASL